MTSLPNRQQFVIWFEEAVAAGASAAAACAEMHLTRRTLQRWPRTGALRADARTTTVRPTPANALSPEERATYCTPPINSIAADVASHLSGGRRPPRMWRRRPGRCGQWPKDGFADLDAART